jgi:hypothetical protein
MNRDHHHHHDLLLEMASVLDLHYDYYRDQMVVIAVDQHQKDWAFLIDHHHHHHAVHH